MPYVAYIYIYTCIIYIVYICGLILQIGASLNVEHNIYLINYYYFTKMNQVHYFILNRSKYHFVSKQACICN